MSRNRISRARYVSCMTYASPGGGHIHRVFDTATADGALIEVGFDRLADGSVRLKIDPASDVWVEHVDPTIDQKPGNVSGLGDLELLNTSYISGKLEHFSLQKHSGKTEDHVQIRDNGVTKVDKDRFSGVAFYDGVLVDCAGFSVIRFAAEDKEKALEPDLNARLDEIAGLLKQIVRQQDRIYSADRITRRSAI